MISSLFVLNSTGKIIIEKHWRGVVSRSVVDYYLNVTKGMPQEEVLPIIDTPQGKYVQIYRDSLTFLTTVSAEVEPLLVLEFLHRVVDLLVEYFDEVSETIIKDNFVTVYQVAASFFRYCYPIPLYSYSLLALGGNDGLRLSSHYRAKCAQRHYRSSHYYQQSNERRWCIHRPV
ncbi:hypothetical protein K7432_012863, partial [Basidiobolus ranarum]